MFTVFNSCDFRDTVVLLSGLLLFCGLVNSCSIIRLSTANEVLKSVCCKNNLNIIKFLYCFPFSLHRLLFIWYISVEWLGNYLLSTDTHLDVETTLLKHLVLNVRIVTGEKLQSWNFFFLETYTHTHVFDDVFVTLFVKYFS